MALPRSAEVTGLLRAWSGGDRAAFDRLASHVYDELHRMARNYMRNERAGNTLQTTALVNEVYLRLVDVKDVDWQQRAQFFAISAQMMRRILVDAARARGSHKRGGGAVKVKLPKRVKVRQVRGPISPKPAIPWQAIRPLMRLTCSIRSLIILFAFAR